MSNKAVTNQTYTFSPLPRNVFIQDNLDPKVKVQSAEIQLQSIKLRRLKGGIKK